MLPQFQTITKFVANFARQFIPSVFERRHWDIELLHPIPHLFKNFSTSHNPHGKISASLRRILLETGIAQTPATSRLDPRAWYAIFRYGIEFAQRTQELRFRSDTHNKDPRLKAIAAEEISTGITCYILREHFNIRDICDAYDCIESGDIEYVNILSEKRPDYFCIGNEGNALIAESKGAIGTRCAVVSAVESEGIEQVRNVRPTKIPLRMNCGRVVIGTHFCVEDMHTRSKTTTLIKDPDGDIGPDKDQNSPNWPTYLAYAKAFRFCGQDILADIFLASRRRGMPQELRLEEHLELYGDIRYYPLGLSPFGDVIGIEKEYAHALFNTRRTMIDTIALSSDSYYRQFTRENIPQEVGFMLSNGIVVSHSYDDLHYAISNT